MSFWKLEIKKKKLTLFWCLVFLFTQMTEHDTPVDSGHIYRNWHQKIQPFGQTYHWSSTEKRTQSSVWCGLPHADWFHWYERKRENKLHFTANISFPHNGSHAEILSRIETFNFLMIHLVSLQFLLWLIQCQVWIFMENFVKGKKVG